MKQKSLCCFTALLMGLTLVPASAFSSDTSVVKAADQQQKGNVDGYDYELWNQDYKGSANMQVGSNGAFSCSWSGIENCLFRTGKKLGSTKKYQDYNGIAIEYDVDYQPMGNSYMCIYGWTEQPTVEYYIVEAWGSWRPPGQASSMGTVSSDGKQYDIYKSTRYNMPSIHGNETFDQYWSVQKSNPAQNNVMKNLKGTITVSNHFQQWEKAGLKMGVMYEVALNIEGYQSNGKAEVKKNGLTFGKVPEGSSGSDTPAQNVPEVTGSAPSGSGTGVTDAFEGKGTDWTTRGDDLSLKLASSFKHGGSQSLYVTGRSQAWQGFSNASSDLKAGGSYSIDLYAGYQDPNYDSAGFTVGLQYTSGGTTSYEDIDSASCSTGKWAELSGNFSIPAGATDISLYVQTTYTENPVASDLIDFFIDDVKLTSSGSSSIDPGTSDPGTSDPGTSNPGHTAPGVSNTSTGYLKDAFASFFKIGTSVSAHELNTASTFIKNHFNSITPENELKPEAIINQGACQQFGNNVNTQVSFGSGAQQIMKFCEDNGIAMRGHTFVWYSQTPDWFFRENFSNNGAYVSSTIMDQRLESFIKNTFAAIAKQYPKLNLYAYDVCNELFVNDGGGLRPANNSNWVRVYGDDSFVEKAFTYARKYAPSGCQLYLNDYNEYMPAKTNDIYNMAMKLKAKGVIDGIGMQSHLDISYPSASVYETAMKKFLSTGLDVQVTELDITSNNESAQASLFKDIFRLCVENAAHVPALTVWGTSDGISWRSSQNPLIFNGQYQPKAAYKSIMDYAKTVENSAPVTQAPPVTQPPVTTTVTTKPPVTQPPVTTTTKTDTPTDLKGDVDCSGTVTASDVIKMMQAMVGKSTLSTEGKNNADLNKDGKLSIVDLILLKNILL